MNSHYREHHQTVRPKVWTSIGLFAFGLLLGVVFGGAAYLRWFT